MRMTTCLISSSPLRGGGSANAFRRFGGINDEAKAAAARLAVEVRSRRRVIRIAPNEFKLCFCTINWTDNSAKYSAKSINGQPLPDHRACDFTVTEATGA